jgi:hypothetical protein
MQPCDGCGRHVKATSPVTFRCPFCDHLTSKRAAKLGAVATMAASVAVGLALSACYGGPPPGYPPPQSPNDPNALPSTTPPATPSPIAPNPK